MIIKNNCKKINRLLYLYREGELNNKEKSLLNIHLKECPTCTAIFKKLQKTDNVLEFSRNQPIIAKGQDEIIENVIRKIKDEKERKLIAKYSTPYQEPLLRILRPVLIGTISLAFCLLAFQQMRDALKIMKLEIQIDRAGKTYFEKKYDEEHLLKHYNNEKQTSPFSLKQSRAYFEGSISDNGLSLWRRLTGKENELADYLRKKYPKLASITIDDGLTAEEREILRTEGNALIKYLEQLMKEGE